MGFKFRISDLGIKLLTAAVLGTGATYGAYQLLPEPRSTEVLSSASETAKPENGIQKSAAFYLEQDGREYALWEGLVIEELDQNEASSRFGTQFDQNIYDFDLGVIMHVSKGSSSMLKTQFNDTMVNGKLPVHIERVREAGCSLAKKFEDRVAAGQGSVPADITVFAARHCAPKGP